MAAAIVPRKWLDVSRMGRKSVDDLTMTLARFVADLRFDDLPPDVVTRAKELSMDLAGSIVRAGSEADSTPPSLPPSTGWGWTGPAARASSEPAASTRRRWPPC